MMRVGNMDFSEIHTMKKYLVHRDYQVAFVDHVGRAVTLREKALNTA
jgi:hypothetical protein